MRLQIDKLGKVSVTIDKDFWSINKDYDKLTIVVDNTRYRSYISRKPVPKGISIDNTDYWTCFSKLDDKVVLDFNEFKTDIKNNYIDKLERYVQEIENLTNRVFDGGNAFTNYGGARQIDCGNAYLN